MSFDPIAVSRETAIDKYREFLQSAVDATAPAGFVNELVAKLYVGDKDIELENFLKAQYGENFSLKKS